MKRNMVTIYVRNENKKLWIRFQKLCEKDKLFKSWRYKRNDSLFSIGLTLLITDYLKRHKDEEFKRLFSIKPRETIKLKDTDLSDEVKLVKIRKDV